MIEQAKTTYSSLGKAFENQVKTTEDQGEKQIKALEEHGKQLVKSSGEKEPLTLLKQKQFFDELANEKFSEIRNLIKQIDFNNLTYHFKGQIYPKSFKQF